MKNIIRKLLKSQGCLVLPCGCVWDGIKDKYIKRCSEHKFGAWLKP